MKRWIVDNVDIPAIRHCHTAGVPMNAGTGVYMNTDGKIYPYITGSDEVYLGVLEAPAYTNKAVTVVYAGYLSIEGSGWTAGVPYLVQNGGNLATTGDFQVAVGVGTDAIVVMPRGSGGGITEDNRGVYFVDKRYDDVAEAHVTGLTPADITSSNTSYTTQLALATRGSTINPWPDPWSARNQAYQDVQDGLIEEATVVVLSGQWLVGSNDPLQNGTVTGSAANANVPADIGFSANTPDISTLLVDKICYAFSPNTKLTYINSNYNIRFGYVSDPTDTPFKSAVTGHLDMEYVFGKKNPISTVTYDSGPIWLDNASADIRIEFNNVMLKPWQFIRSETIKELHVKVKYFEGTDILLCNFLVRRDAPSGYCKVTQEYDTILLKPNDLDTDWWALFRVQGNFPTAVENTRTDYTVKINNLTATQSFEDFDTLITVPGNTAWNTNISVDIKNASLFCNKAYKANCALVSLPFFGGRYLNLDVNLGNLVTEYPITRVMTLNTKDSSGNFSTEENTFVNISVKNGRKIQNALLNAAVPSAKYALIFKDDGYLSSLGGGTVHVDANIQSEESIMYTQPTGNVGNSAIYKVSGILRVTSASAKPVVVLDKNGSNKIALVDCVLSNNGSTFTIDNGAINPLQANTILIKNVMATADLNSAVITPVGETVTVNAGISQYIR